MAKSSTTVKSADSTVKRRVVVTASVSASTAKFITNLTNSALTINTTDGEPIRGKKNRIRKAGEIMPDVILKPLEKISDEANPDRYTEVYSVIKEGGIGNKHASMLRERGMLSFEG